METLMPCGFETFWICYAIVMRHNGQVECGHAIPDDITYNQNDPDIKVFVVS